MFYLLHCDQAISHSSALNECEIWGLPRAPVILCSLPCELWNQHVTIRSLTCKHPTQHVMVHSLACYHPFLTMQAPVPTCKVPFLNMQGSVPTCKDPFHHVTIRSFAQDHSFDSNIQTPQTWCTAEHLTTSEVLATMQLGDHHQDTLWNGVVNVSVKPSNSLKMPSSLIVKFLSGTVRSLTSHHLFHHVMVRSLAC